MIYHLVVALLLATLIASPVHADSEGFTRISLISGDVLLRDSEEHEWYPASINTPLVEGDSIWCPKGARTEIQLQNGSFVRLDSSSSLDIIELSDDYQRFYLSSGRLYARTGKRSTTLQVDLGETSVTVSGRSQMNAELIGDDEEISIYAGSAYVESAGGRARVRAGETMTVHDDSSELSPLQPPDRWRQWNVRRDRKVFAAKSGARYLPEELSPYEDELTRNGEWITVTGYGTVWRPTVIIAADWAPYRNGRWVWRGSTYVWISYDAWGWAPHHYGRWISHPTRGWCWVPPGRGDVFWAPGYVAWVSTPAYVGWAPLAPGEIYLGRGHYGRFSVNITSGPSRDYGDQITRYRHVSARNAVTVINRDDFSSGRSRPRAARENLFRTSRDHAFVPPATRPSSREARMPLVKQVNQARLPPPGRTRPTVQSIRERYPRLKEPAREPSSLRDRSGATGQKQQPAVEPKVDDRTRRDRTAPRPATPATQPAQQTRPATGEQVKQPAPVQRDRSIREERQVAPPAQPKPDREKREIKREEKQEEGSRQPAERSQRKWRIEQKDVTPQPAKRQPREQSKEQPKEQPKEQSKEQRRVQPKEQPKEQPGSGEKEHRGERAR